MTRDDYEQYEAAHPDGVKLDLSNFPESLPEDEVDDKCLSCDEGDAEYLSCDEGNDEYLSGDEGDAEGDAEEDAEDDAEEDAGSEASSEFILNPDDAGSNASSGFITNPDDDPNYQYTAWACDENTIDSPYKRPSNPEPTTPVHHNHLTNNNVNTTIYPTAPTATSSHNPQIPTSPYRRRSTPNSWTGLELTPWGEETYVTPSGTMALRQIDEISSGEGHGLLQRCAWGGYPDQASAPVSAGPELKLTTPSGAEWWLDDGVEQYAYEFVYEVDAGYGHWCGEECGEFYDGGREQEHALGQWLENVQETQDGQVQGGNDEEDDEGFWMEPGEWDGELEGEDYMKMQVKEYARRLNKGKQPEPKPQPKPVPKPVKQNPWGLETILEEDEEQEEAELGGGRQQSLKIFPEEDEEESEIDPMDGDLLDRLADAVLTECDLRKEIAVPEAAGTQAENAVLEESTQEDELVLEPMDADGIDEDLMDRLADVLLTERDVRNAVAAREAAGTQGGEDAVLGESTRGLPGWMWNPFHGSQGHEDAVPEKSTQGEETAVLKESTQGGETAVLKESTQEEETAVLGESTQGENAVLGKSTREKHHASPTMNTRWEEEMGVKGLPRWLYDPQHVSNRSWAEMAEDEEEW